MSSLPKHVLTLLAEYFDTSYCATAITHTTRLQEQQFVKNTMLAPVDAHYSDSAGRQIQLFKDCLRWTVRRKSGQINKMYGFETSKSL